MRVRLKPITVHRHGADLALSVRALRRVHLNDPTGAVAELLALLAEASREVPELAAALAARGYPTEVADIDRVLAALDEVGAVQADEPVDPAVNRRHASNLRFYDLFSSLRRTSADLHSAVTASHVLLLGAGGLGAGILQSLVGLGVGRVTLVDFDIVEEKNLARQFAYGLSALGMSKVEAAARWVAGYSNGTEVVPVRRRVEDVDSIQELGADADLIVCAADSPDNLHLLVNEASFRLGVPFVAGGLSYSTLSYWSVDPGRSPCRNCLELNRIEEGREQPAVFQAPPFIEGGRGVNRAAGPVVQLICGLMSLEVMRYLCGFEPPLAAATYHVIELADRLSGTTAAWPTNPGCLLCAAGPRSRPRDGSLTVSAT